MKLKSLFKNKTVKNVEWIVGGKIVQMALSFLVGVFTARYLGPSNQGLIDYATAYTTVFHSLCTLGIDSVIVKNFVDYPDEQGVTLGSAIGARLISSIISLILIVGIVAVVDMGETTTLIVVSLCSMSVVFNVFSSIDSWFQNRLQSKFSSIATLVGYVAVSLYRIVLLMTGASVYWFAVSLSIDYIVIAICLIFAYKKNGGPKLSFSKAKAKQLLKSSYHFIISGLMIAIYNATDKLMLKQFINEAEVSYYARANTICTMWCFILGAIITSVTPTIMRLHGKDDELYKLRNKQLYAVMFYVSAIVSVAFTLLADFLMPFLYGAEFAPASAPLKVLTWLTAFSYLGVARNIWIVCEKKQQYLKYLYLIAAIGNVALNIVFIPLWGATGAAFASLLTQILTAIIVPLLIKPLRENSVMMLEGIILKGVFKKTKPLEEEIKEEKEEEK